MSAVDDSPLQLRGSMNAALIEAVRVLGNAEVADEVARELRLVAAREVALLHRLNALEEVNADLILEINVLSDSLRNAHRVLEDHWNSRLWAVYRLYQRVRRRR